MGAIGGRSNGADRSNRCNGCNRSNGVGRSNRCNGSNRSNGVGRSNGCNGADGPDSQSYLVPHSVHAEKAIARIPRAPRRSYRERPCAPIKSVPVTYVR